MPSGRQTAAEASDPIATAMDGLGEGCSERRPLVGEIPGGARRSSKAAELTPEKASKPVKKPRTAAGSAQSVDSSTSAEGSSCDLLSDRDGMDLVSRSEFADSAPSASARVTRAGAKREEVQLFPMLPPPPKNPARITRGKNKGRRPLEKTTDVDSDASLTPAERGKWAKRQGVRAIGVPPATAGPTGGGNPVRRCWALQAALMAELANEANVLRPAAMGLVTRIMSDLMGAVAELAEAAPRGAGAQAAAPITVTRKVAGGEGRDRRPEVVPAPSWVSVAAAPGEWVEVARKARPTARQVVERQRTRSSQRKDAVVVVRAEGKVSAETAAVMVSQVTTMKAKVHGVHEGKEGRVIIRAADIAEANRIAAALTGVTVVTKGKRLPRVIVFGVPTAQATSEGMQEPLGLASPPEIALTKATGSDYAATCNVVVEVNAEDLRRLETQGRIFVGHRSCQVREKVDDGHCYQCGSHGHRKGDCKSESLCYKCGRPGHIASKCVAAAAHCVHCAEKGKPATHASRSLECPLKRLAEGRARVGISYV